SANRTLIDSALARQSIKSSWFYEVAHLSTSLGLVEAGLGVSVLPRMATPTEPHHMLVSRALGAPRVTRTVGLLRRRSPGFAPDAQRCMEILMSRPISEW